MRRLAAVAAGGAVGAGLRFALLLAAPVEAGALPATILAGNLLGALALGLVTAVLAGRLPRAVHLQAFLTTGVIGSFTTFSAVSVDLVGLAEAGRWGSAAIYAAASVGGGLLAAAAGLAAGRRLAGRAGSPAERAG